MLKHNLLLLALLVGATAAADSAPVVIAKVDGEPIYASEVNRLVQAAAGRQPINPAVLPLLRAQALAELVDRRLLLVYARREKTGAGAAEVEAALAALRAKLSAQGSSLEESLKKQAMTEAELRRQLTWSLTWEGYLGKYATETRVEEYFAAHRREFDGTELAVSHILLRPKGDGGAQATAKLLPQAEQIRQQIVGGKLAFAEAARKYSAGPSAAEGGKLGLIARRGAMPESFARAAFALQVGQISEPVVTPFGVHLIHCDQVKPGSRQLDAVRKDVVEALGRELLAKLAAFERSRTAVEFTGAMPYFKPGTRELVAP